MEIIRAWTSKGGISIRSIPYGKSSISLNIPPGVEPDWIYYHRFAPAASDCIEQALVHPIGCLPLELAAKECKTAVILISDMTRLCPSHLFLGSILQRLHRAGISDENIRIIVALGIHRKQTNEELIELVGEAIYKRICVMNHSSLSEDCIHLGITRLGTPVEINKYVVEAEFRIVTGNLEPHALVGVSGGIKAIFPGTASAAAIEHNHSLSQQFSSSPGTVDNPIRTDMEEVLHFLPVHFLLNVIVDHERKLLGAVAGHVISAHRAGLELVRRTFVVEVPHLYDVVVVSPGGYPKDTQLYQSVKALKNASAITKYGGTILLVAQCEEQYGNGLFEHWVETIQDRSLMIYKLQQRFVLGAHKIAHIDQVLTRHRVYIYSDFPSASALLLGFHPINDLNEFLMDQMSEAALKTAIIPYGGLTYPQLRPL
ncbi:nickel-dependent lactate racemase [Paenibacillus sp. SYP-B3998]|uniref:Nickel-dependent lactate racemase n=1 Tax=Paenibacillus sp. SYP-B3998 TaxID=2678564 RepID=A0A6G4A6I3_9BACL|nr:nickel-dependent lactate racemase [Paenibacillus sp. SYP-B3998]NEW09554.1 nickel-dependent lactate racemase [Paenibacillus sp. SYP-B3998]